MNVTRTPLLQVRVLPGLTPYERAHRLQLETVEHRKVGAIPDTLLLVEHEPVITLGKNAGTGGVVASPEILAARGIAVHRIERGGQATYHGPGQVVGYPIIDLHARHIGVATYVRKLERAMIATASHFGVETHLKEGITGVFTERGKLGAIGVRVTRGITYHGFAFNVTTDLSHYEWIVPCGLTDIGVTSLADLRGAAPSLDAVRRKLARDLADELGLSRTSADVRSA